MNHSHLINLRYQELTAQLDLPNLSGTVNERVEQLLTQLRDTQEALEKAQKDTKLMDWFDKNIFHRELDSFDRMLYKESTMWVTFAPNGVQGSARAILTAAMLRDDPESEEE